MRKKQIALAASFVIFGVLFTLPVLAAEVNHSPCLCGAKITPIQGGAKSVYIAEVRYSDPENDPPAKVEVYVNGVAYPMRLVKGKPAAGIYRTRLTLPVGEHTHFFYAEDIRGASERFPRISAKPGPFVGVGKKVYNRLPILTNGGYHEDYVTGEGVFTFSLNYLDKDGQKPKAVRVVIDGIPSDMTLHLGSPANGIYLYKTKLSPGPHAYYFVGIDDCGACVLHPQQGVLYVPSVEEKGNLPPQLRGNKVEPAAGTPTTVYTYYVEYLDPDCNPPARAEVYINGKPHQMKLVGGKPSSGVYRYRTRLYLGAYHNYYFYFEDGNGGFCRYPEVGYFHGPVVVK